MELLIFAIPIIVAIILFCKFREQTTPLEYLLVLVPSILLFLLIKFVIVKVETSDTQYTGQYVTKVKHYDEWDEWIHRTCYRTHRIGKRTIRTSYDCSYRLEHPERWVMVTNTGNEIYIDENEFNSLKNKWGTPMKFIDMNRHYYRKDGDAQSYDWDGKRLNSRTVTVSSFYENRVKVSHSIFKLENINDKYAEELGLFKYPEIDEDGDQLSILGYRAFPESVKKMKFINGYYGKQLQLRTYLLIFKNKPYSISEKQRSYWDGGNKNEIVICIGIDSLTQKVQWTNAFSWMDNPMLELKVEDYFLSKNNKPISINQFCDWYETKGIKLWEIKEFKDFDYISVELTAEQYKYILIFILIYNILISIYVINNEYRNW